MASELALYQKAIDVLISLGLKRTAPFITNSQTALKTTLRRDLAKFDIDSVDKSILSTDENWSLAGVIVAQCEDAIDTRLISPSGDVLVELHDRAYKLGSKYAADLSKFSHKGYDAATLKLIRRTALSQIIGIGEDQKAYIRDMLTKAVIENETIFQTMDVLIRDGKVPAFYDRSGKLWEMETRVENVVRTQSSRIAEQGSLDKSKEIFGGEENMEGKWHGINDGNMRESHFIRLNVVRTAQEWLHEPYTDGKIIKAGHEPRCRCSMEWRPLGYFARQAA